VARIGGDEFAMLMPGSPERVVAEVCERLDKSVLDYNARSSGLPLSISVGYAVGKKATVRMEELFKQADNNMYRKKLRQSETMRSAIIQTVIKLLEARDFFADGHAERMQQLVLGLAQQAGIPASREASLRLFAQFHDIGKVGIRDEILFKSGPFTPEETAEMQRHSEIGHRIAQSTPNLLLVADWILKHHEWWDGAGYPLGLKGEEIPQECRILAIADAFDAMTSSRPYRKTIPPVAAVAEIESRAGSQFDPELVKLFVRGVKS
jgi:HD-GYP domain-containing protein (c-di-GMP phosphodiesterase class II)